MDNGYSDKDLAEDEETFPTWAKYPRLYKDYTRLRSDQQRSWPTATKVFWGGSGVGKSRRALFEGGSDAFWLPRPLANGQVWWDGYDGQETVVIDDFTCWIPLNQMLRMLDRYPLNVQTKGSTVPFKPRTIIITSNFNPRNWYEKCPQEQRDSLFRRLGMPFGPNQETDDTFGSQVYHIEEPWSPPPPPASPRARLAELADVAEGAAPMVDLCSESDDESCTLGSSDSVEILEPEQSLVDQWVVDSEYEEY